VRGLGKFTIGANVREFTKPIQRAFVALTTVMLVFPPQLLAQVGNGITIDSRAMSLGNAVVADRDPSIAAVYHNPAGLTNLKDRQFEVDQYIICLLYTSPSPRDRTRSRMPSSA